MPRKPSARVVLNRSKVHAVMLAVADGLHEVGRTIIEVASETAPDSPYDPFPTGEGLPKQGGVLTYVDGQKVAGWSTRGTQPAKPRAANVKRGITAVVGFGFPGRFAELGTVRHGAQPFLAPARDSVVPHMSGIMADVVKPALARLP
jgi:hypothetical protein